MPTMDEYFEEALDQADPESGVEAEYKWVTLIWTYNAFAGAITVVFLLQADQQPNLWLEVPSTIGSEQSLFLCSAT